MSAIGWLGWLSWLCSSSISNCLQSNNYVIVIILRLNWRSGGRCSGICNHGYYQLVQLVVQQLLHLWHWQLLIVLSQGLYENLVRLQVTQY
jgi:hypothetical protein